MKYSIVRCSVTKKTQYHISFIIHFTGQSCSNRHRDTSSDDSIFSQYAKIHIGNMHRATSASAVTIRFSKKFGHHFFYIGTPGYAVTMASMIGNNVILSSDCLTCPYRNSLLTDTGVEISSDLPDPVKLDSFLLKFSD